MRFARALGFAALLLAARDARAQLAPYHRYRTLETQHFHVHVPAGLEREGRVAGAAAEKAYAQLASSFVPPRGMIDLVVGDDADYSNGYATPVPANRIVVFATPPIESGGLRFAEDWLALVITHELTHIFHLDRTRGIWSLAQHVFGRGPALFPNLYGPSWFTEGLAVYEESRLTEGGRLRDAEHRLIARAAAADNRFPRLDQLSLGTAVFPGGTRAYAYGSLFVEYLARTRGDSALRRFVEAQATGLLPVLLEGDARTAFGTSFRDAYDTFADSVQRNAGTYQPPIAGWREITAHPFYATDPRWVSEGSLVYSGSDGRSSPQEFSLALDGSRRGMGRRNTLGPSAPLADGSLLFAQLDYTSTAEVRSDLYVEQEGTQRRITRGERLVQPDVRADSVIVAVQLAPTRSSLLLLDLRNGQRRLLRDAAPDETWSEPRWSPDGRSIAAIHKPHGNVFSLEVIDVATGAARTLDRGRWLLASPTWRRDGSAVLYTSERGGELSLMQATTRDSISQLSMISSQRGANGIYTPEVSPANTSLAASDLRADGYHLGIAPLSSLGFQPAERTAAQLAPRDSEPLAPGNYHAYHFWRSALPRYWYPTIEAAPGRGTRLGAQTSGQDVLGRHSYDANVAIPTTGSYPVGALTYRYAGFARPLIDVAISQDYTAEAQLLNGGTPDFVGTLLRRSQDASLALSFTRPRYRTFSAVSLGGGVERRNFVTDPADLRRQLSPVYANTYFFPRVQFGAQWSNLQRPALSISQEDGVSLAFTARERWRTDSAVASRSASVVGTAAGFKSLDLPGFAHHVIALRVAGGLADRRASTAFEVGGTSGTTIELVPGYSVGEGRRTFGIRGFPTASSYGTRAAAGSLEYRAPLALPTRGIGLLPFYFDRASVTAFGDAGVASCGDLVVVQPPAGSTVDPSSLPRNPGVCAPAARLGKTLASVGAEVGLAAAVLDWDTPQNIRAGFAVPVSGRAVTGASVVSAYLAYGLSF